MDCPKGHGQMHMYEESLMTEKFVCKVCNVQQERNTTTGTVVEIGVAAVALVVALLGFGQ